MVKSRFLLILVKNVKLNNIFKIGHSEHHQKGGKMGDHISKEGEAQNVFSIHK